MITGGGIIAVIIASISHDVITHVLILPKSVVIKNWKVKGTLILVNLTSEQWKQIEDKLCFIGAKVTLKIDGYKVELIVLPENKLKNVIAVYVDGLIKGAWVINDCEIRRKFYFKSARSLLKPKELKKLSKKRQNELKEKYTYYSYSPYFNSFKALKSQLIKNNQKIELEEL